MELKQYIIVRFLCRYAHHQRWLDGQPFDKILRQEDMPFPQFCSDFPKPTEIELHKSLERLRPFRAPFFRNSSENVDSVGEHLMDVLEGTAFQHTL